MCAVRFRGRLAACPSQDRQAAAAAKAKPKSAATTPKMSPRFGPAVRLLKQLGYLTRRTDYRAFNMFLKAFKRIFSPNLIYNVFFRIHFLCHVRFSCFCILPTL